MFGRFFVEVVALLQPDQRRGDAMLAEVARLAVTICE
jgi:hypothetical protein